MTCLEPVGRGLCERSDRDSRLVFVFICAGRFASFAVDYVFSEIRFSQYGRLLFSLCVTHIGIGYTNSIAYHMQFEMPIRGVQTQTFMSTCVCKFRCSHGH